MRAARLSGSNPSMKRLPVVAHLPADLVFANQIIAHLVYPAEFLRNLTRFA